MRIKAIYVKGLFGTFDHIVNMKLADRITIIHGPNGFGKTILLQMLNELFKRQYSMLRSVPYQQFDVEFDDGSYVSVKKQKTEPPPEQQPLFKEEISARRGSHRHVIPVELIIRLTRKPAGRALEFKTKYGDDEPLDLPLSTIDRRIPELERVGPRRWLHLPTSQVLTLEEVLRRFGDILPFRLPVQPDWWVDFTDSVSISLIGAERLLNIRDRGEGASYRSEREPSIVRAVTDYSQELAGIVSKKVNESYALSQSLDRTFPKRLVEQMGHSRLSVAKIKQRLSELEAKRSRLQEAGLLDKEEGVGFVPTKIEGSAKNVLAVYVQDVEQKLSVFDDLMARIELFKNMINRRFMYKQMAISREGGIAFTTSDGKPLPVTALSSGEQHEVVLLYQLLFKVTPDSLILIDEPELSLHVAWQKQFLRDLEEITKLSSFDVLIATHSPQIIHNRWDLTVELKGAQTKA